MFRLLQLFLRLEPRRTSAAQPATQLETTSLDLAVVVPAFCGDKKMSQAAVVSQTTTYTDYPPDRFSLLAILNRGGSVEHFFHFLLGFVAPLILRSAPEAGRCYLVRSCGPLDSAFAELAFPDIQQITKTDWLERSQCEQYCMESVTGLDSPEHFDAAAFAALRAKMLALFGLVAKCSDQPVLLIDRGPPPDAYRRPGVENPTTASQRRSVPNMLEIEAALAMANITCSLIALEAATLRMQVTLFASARTVVAQHGAALVNMIWMAPGGTIIEILPNVGERGRISRLLADMCGHRYASVRQPGLHARVDAKAVARAVQLATST